MGSDMGSDISLVSATVQGTAAFQIVHKVRTYVGQRGGSLSYSENLEYPKGEATALEARWAAFSDDCTRFCDDGTLREATLEATAEVFEDAAQEGTESLSASIRANKGTLDRACPRENNNRALAGEVSKSNAIKATVSDFSMLAADAVDRVKSFSEWASWSGRGPQGPQGSQSCSSQ